MIRLFYHDDSAAAVAKGKAMRLEKKVVSVTHTLACHEADAVENIEFMPDVPAFERSRLRKLFGIAETALPPPPPLPPPPVDPLAGLVASWRSMPPQELRTLAASISDGRMPENKTQAIEMIEQALKKRGK